MQSYKFESDSSKDTTPLEYATAYDEAGLILSNAFEYSAALRPSKLKKATKLASNTNLFLSGVKSWPI